MEPRAEEELAEHVLYRVSGDPGAVVLGCHLELVALGPVEFNPDVGENPCFLARVQGVVDGFLDGRDYGPL